MTELLVGTKKGLFVLSGEPGEPFSVTERAFAGEPVEYAMRDPHTGRILATMTSPFYGPKIFYSEDGEWTQATGVQLPEGGEQALERIWVIVPGEDGDPVRGRRSGRALREPRRRGDLGAQPHAVGAPDAAGLAAGRRRAVPALDRAMAGRAGQARAGDVRGRRVADRGRRRDLEPRQPGHPPALPARRRARGHDQPLRARPGARAEAARAPVHPVPRRRLSLRRRRPHLDVHRRRAAVGLRLPARRRPGRSRQRVRDPAQGRHGSRHARGPRVRVRDPRRGRDLDAARRRDCPPSTRT